MKKLKKDNHFIPQMYLKNWSEDRHVYVYKKIVEHQKVPLWKKLSLKGIGYTQYLYVNTTNGQEDDFLEEWFDKLYESPAEKSLSKVISGKKLTQTDYANLIRFLALQDLRTPKKYIEQLAKLNNDDFTKILEGVLSKLDEKTTHKDLEIKNESSFHESLPLKVSIEKLDDSMSVQAKILGGRAYWLWSIRRLLEKTAHNLHHHKWMILRPACGIDWLTGDNPVVKLNFFDEKNYNLGGGWGSKGTDIFMPLSPKHLLFTCVGEKRRPREKTMSREQTMLINKIIVENCHRYVISNAENDIVEKLHSRVICPKTVKHERIEWEKWHKEQQEAEENFLKGFSDSNRST